MNEIMASEKITQPCTVDFGILTIFTHFTKTMFYLHGSTRVVSETSYNVSYVQFGHLPPPTCADLCLIISFTAALLLDSACRCNLLKCSLRSLEKSHGDMSICTFVDTREHEIVTKRLNYKVKLGEKPSRNLEGFCDSLTCILARYILILCKHGHGVEGDTTSFYKAHNLQMHAFCTAYHDGKVLSISGNWHTGTVVNCMLKNAPEAPASSEAVISVKAQISSL